MADMRLHDIDCSRLQVPFEVPTAMEPLAEGYGGCGSSREDLDTFGMVRQQRLFYEERFVGLWPRKLLRHALVYSTMKIHGHVEPDLSDFLHSLTTGFWAPESPKKRCYSALFSVAQMYAYSLRRDPGYVSSLRVEVPMVCASLLFPTVLSLRGLDLKLAIRSSAFAIGYTYLI